jgi:hypothetical protein
MLLAPSPAIQLHAHSALAGIHPPSPELPAHAQLRGLIYAVRWEMGIASSEFLSSVLEGERWLVWAAGNVRHVHINITSSTCADSPRTDQGRRTSVCTPACPCCTPERSETGSTQSGSLVLVRS